MAKVSIIVPIYNVESTLAACVDSILGQSEPDIEVILVDDGSTDSSPAMVDGYAAHDPRVKAVHQANQGLSGARNTGIAQVGSEWFMIVDGDDWLDPDSVARMLATVEGQDVDLMLFSYYLEQSGKSEHMSFFTVGDFDYDRNRMLWLEGCCLVAYQIGNPGGTNAGVTWARLYRTAFLREHGLSFKVGLLRMQDAIFHLYAFGLARKVGFRDIPVYHYRVWGGAASRKYDPNFTRTAEEILAEIDTFVDRTGTVGFNPIYYTKAAKLFIDALKQQFAPLSNPMKLSSKLRAMRALLRQPVYARALEQAVPAYMSPGQRLAWRLVKACGPLPAYLLFRARAWLSAGLGRLK